MVLNPTPITKDKIFLDLNNKTRVMLRTIFLIIFIFLSVNVSAEKSSDLSRSEDKWRSNMLQIGKRLANDFQNKFTSFTQMHSKIPFSISNTGKDPWYETLLSSSYYDRGAVYYQIYNLTKDPEMYLQAQKSVKFYRDFYVLPNEGRIPGYWNFSDGLLIDYLQSKDNRSLEAITFLSKNAAYVIKTSNAREDNTQSAELSREIAYAIRTLLNARQLNVKIPEERLNELLKQSIGHLKQWAGQAKWIGINHPSRAVQPFMVGLTARTLIGYYNDKQALPELKPEIIKALAAALKSVWTEGWNPNQSGFRYAYGAYKGSEGETEPSEVSADLNLLIFPAYSWIAQFEGYKYFCKSAKEIFDSGVSNAWLDRAKQFNQNYLWSIQGVDWYKKHCN